MVRSFKRLALDLGSGLDSGSWVWALCCVPH